MKKFSQPPSGDDRDAEIRRLKCELARVTEEHDILKMGKTQSNANFAKDAK